MNQSEKLAEVTARVNAMSLRDFVAFIKMKFIQIVAAVPEEQLDQLLAVLPEVPVDGTDQ